MKIAMILRPDAGQVPGGDSVAMENLAHALRQLGASVVVAPLTDIGPAREYDLLHLFGMAPVTNLPEIVAWAGTGPVAFLCSPLYWNDFRDWFERAVINVAHWRLLARVAGKRLAWHAYRAFRQARLPRDAAWQALRATLLAADAIATTSQWENAWVAEHFHLPAAMRRAMRLSPLGIDAALYGQTFTPEQLVAFRGRHGLPAGYIAQVARIEEKKNQLGLIQALYDDPTPLVFVGKPSPYYAPDYAQRCRETGARRGDVHFLGWLPTEELPLLYAAAAAHMLPSWMELPGLSSLEAGASGTRVISTDRSPIPELLGAQAWVCDPYDTVSIRRAVRTALAQPVPAGLRERLLDRFSWPAVAAINLLLYEDILRAR